MDDSAIICNEIIESYDEDTDADTESKSNKSAKSNDEAKSYDETRTILTNFNEKKTKIIIFCLHFC